MAPSPQYRPLDGGWGWMVVIASFFSVFLLSSCVTSFAIMFDEFIDEFELSRWQTGLIGSVQLALAFIHNIPAGVLVQKFGCRAICFTGFFIGSAGLGASCWAVNYIMLFFTYGVITGIGLGLAMLPVFLSVQIYFNKKRSLAVGLALCGINLSSFVTGPLMRLTVDFFGWRGATLLHSGVMLHGLLFACAFRPLKPVATQPSEAGTDKKSSCWQGFLNLFDFALLKQRRFLLYIVGNFFINFSGMTFSQHLVSFGLVQGLSASSAALLPTIIGVSSATGRILAGVLGDRKSVDRRFLAGGFALGAGSVVCFSFLGTDIISIAILCGLFGTCIGTFSTLQFTVLVDLVTVARIAQAQAFFSAFMGSSSLFSGPLTGYLVDKTGNYNLPFFINGIMHVTGGAILLVVGQLHREHVTATSAMNGHATGNGDVRENNNVRLRRKENAPERVELIITTV